MAKGDYTVSVFRTDQKRKFGQWDWVLAIEGYEEEFRGMAWTRVMAGHNAIEFMENKINEDWFNAQ